MHEHGRSEGHVLDLLSEYMDGELEPAREAELEKHLDDCAACAAVLADLREVVAGAQRLEPRRPETDLWPGIAARLSPRTPDAVGAGGAGSAAPPSPDLGAGRRRASSNPFRRRVWLTVPQLAAAAIALVLFSATGVWLALGGMGSPADGPQGSPLAADREATSSGPAPASGPAAFMVSYEAAITDLESEFQRQREQLDPATIHVVERNLAIIDEAITEARRALAEDPGSGFLNGYLADTMRRKVDLLRQATRIQQTET